MLRSSSPLKVVRARFTQKLPINQFAFFFKQFKSDFMCFPALRELLMGYSEKQELAVTHERCAQWDFPTSTYKLKAAFPVSAYVHSPEASPGSPVLPMLDSRWSMLGAGCTSSVSTGVCGGWQTRAFLFRFSPQQADELRRWWWWWRWSKFPISLCRFLSALDD